ncbi:hypothetical protein KQ51_00189 [Candidatus Izimaplasma bacterium HR1]|jgi:hypothetical protein|uniref:hypothetical protein n=1 Tax=Candidatus Izimoplasma sp. HR1 TaxID=1541959 RepID=UPI0004F66C9C|nr:hypothetical protein KQ51_00189 [Candidatus Izimaplasma bacterium HR1]
MEKYAFIKELTKKYLDGDLSTLRMDYNSTKIATVDVIYEDYNKYRFDYILEIDKESKKVKFLKHFCEYGRDQIGLKRNKVFEDAVKEYLFEQI